MSLTKAIEHGKERANAQHLEACQHSKMQLVAKMGEQAGQLAAMTAERDAMRERAEARCANCAELQIVNVRPVYAYCTKFRIKFELWQMDTRTHCCESHRRGPVAEKEVSAP